MIGDLETWPLAEILLWLHRTGRTAVVQMGTDSVRGIICFNDGCLFHCQWGQARGELALGALLTMTRGFVHLDESDGQQPNSNIQGATDEVIKRWTVAHDGPGLAVMVD